jgi:hypothetical protein
LLALIASNGFKVAFTALNSIVEEYVLPSKKLPELMLVNVILKFACDTLV